MSNQKIVFASILGAILATGLLALNPSTITNAGAQIYGNYEYGYDNHPKKSSHTDIQKIKCINSNINVNGIDITQIPQDNNAISAANEGTALEGTNTQNGNGLTERINFEKNLVNFCINDNDNSQERQQQSESNGITVGSLYIVEGPLVTSQGEADPITESIASCDAGDFVISGGFNYLPKSLPLIDLDFIKSIPTPTLDGWSASFDTDDDSPQIQATAVCFDAS